MFNQLKNFNRSKWMNKNTIKFYITYESSHYVKIGDVLFNKLKLINRGEIVINYAQL